MRGKSRQLAVAYSHRAVLTRFPVHVVRKLEVAYMAGYRAGLLATKKKKKKKVEDK